MGFFGLNSFYESDSASDLMYDIVQDIINRLDKESKKPNSTNNTDGPINVLLITKSLLQNKESDVTNELLNNIKFINIIEYSINKVNKLDNDEALKLSDHISSLLQKHAIGLT